MHTKSKPLNYVTVHKLHNKTKGIILKMLRLVIIMYLTRGFTITDVYRDNKFDNDDYREIFLLARTHICAQGEHVRIIERSEER